MTFLGSPTPADASAAGYRSIGDSSTGYEHYIKYSNISDGKMLDSTAPESIVYKVKGDKRIVVSAMYIAEPDYPFGSKQLDELMGGLVTWHNHDNLCWQVGPDGPKVVAVTDNHGGTCPAGSIHAGGEAAMVHVWITPHKCGVFSALEGHGAGQSFDRGQHASRPVRARPRARFRCRPVGAEQLAAAVRPNDPIDLSGVEGVSKKQENFGATLIKDTIRELPRYATQEAAMADGYFSIGDAGTGEEHLVKPSNVADGNMLDPSAPESLVYKAEGDKRTLAGAMFMAEPGYELGTERLNYAARPARLVACAHERVLRGRSRRRARRPPATAPRGTWQRPLSCRWCTCGSRRTRVDRSPRSRASAPGRRRAETTDRVDQCSAEHGH